MTLLVFTAGSISASKVATLTITDFGGSIDVNTKVDNLTVEMHIALDIADATDLETLTVQGVQAFGKIMMHYQLLVN